jgi:hypothetical protein
MNLVTKIRVSKLKINLSGASPFARWPIDSGEGQHGMMSKAEFLLGYCGAELGGRITVCRISAHRKPGTGFGSGKRRRMLASPRFAR